MQSILSVIVIATLFSAAQQKVIADKPNQLDSGECLNKSQDTICNKPLSSDKSREASPTSAEPDDEVRLKSRLRTIDQLHLQGLSESLELSLVKESDDSTLRQVLFLHRHGDRTPIVFPPKDNLASEPFWTFHGLGQLTNRGKARLYLLGKLIRKRYNKFLGSLVNKNQRVTRSSGTLRCIESAETFLAGFLRLDLPDSPDEGGLIWDKNSTNPLAHLWQPASVQAVPQKLDGMLAESAECKTLTEEYDNIIDNSDQVKKLNEDYAKEKDLLNEVLGFELDRFYKWFWASSLIEVERSYFPDKIRPEILSSFDRIQDAGNKALGPYQSTLNSKRLRHGLLISDMVHHMKTMRNERNIQLTQQQSLSTSGKSKKFVHYAGHDLTLVVILGMLNVWDELGRRPNYASNIAIELHEANINGTSDNEWFVEFLYMEKVPSKPVRLHMKQCENDHSLKRCNLDKFVDLMKPYMIDSWQDWMRECKNDFTMVNPYEPGS